MPSKQKIWVRVSLLAKVKHLQKIQTPIESVYHSKQFLQYLIKRGEHGLIENLFRKELIKCAENQKDFAKNFSTIFKNIFLTTKPLINVKSRRKGSKNIYIPFKITSQYGTFLAASWIIDSVKEKKKRNFMKEFLLEINETFLQKSSSVVKYKNLHKLADENLSNLKKRKR